MWSFLGIVNLMFFFCLVCLLVDIVFYSLSLLIIFCMSIFGVEVLVVILICLIFLSYVCWI